MIDDAERNATIVTTLPLIHKDPVCVHRPVVVDGIENIRGRQLDRQRLVKESLAH